jgi:hypothetical protein
LNNLLELGRVFLGVTFLVISGLPLFGKSGKPGKVMQSLNWYWKYGILTL